MFSKLLASHVAHYVHNGAFKRVLVRCHNVTLKIVRHYDSAVSCSECITSSFSVHSLYNVFGCKGTAFFVLSESHFVTFL
jgi:hypothetical protein